MIGVSFSALSLERRKYLLKVLAQVNIRYANVLMLGGVGLGIELQVPEIKR